MLRWIITTLCLGVVCMGACIQSDPDLTGWKCTGDAECGTARVFRCESTRNICLGVCLTQADCKPTERCKDGLCFPECTGECSKSQEPSVTEHAQDGSEAVVSSERPCVPGKVEVCGNGVDDNCDGQIDESPPCVCKSGDTRPCFEESVGCTKAPNDTGDWQCKGLCKVGVQTCTPDQTWGTCIGAVVPDVETCDGKDNDCDGQVDGDEIPGVGGLCGVLGKQGPCATGTTICANGKIECKQTVQPGAELCDGKDNDCNGAIDDHPDCKCTAPQTQECYNANEKTAGIGPCKKGTQDCDSNGKWGPCKDQVLPTPELCDGIDNDCNGKIDETFPARGKACADPSRKGECAPGTLACAGGKEVCKANVQPAPTEECDGKDGNCNGKTDLEDGCTCINGTTQTCYTGPANTRNVGNCSDGSQLCVKGKWDICKGDVRPVAETCGNDGKDEDCDGQINEQPPCTCINGNTQKCGSDKGECKQGTQTCGNDGSYGPCVGEVKATVEICDGKDNNCDGFVDENCPCNYINKAQGVCATATRDSKGACLKPAGYNIKEICGDNLDNNCNGLVDRIDASDQCFSYAKGCIFTGVSPAGTKDVCTVVNYQCSQSSKVCPGPTTPSSTMCPTSPGVVSCFTQADCGPCSAALGGNFSCFQQVCIRHAP